MKFLFRGKITERELHGFIQTGSNTFLCNADFVCGDTDVTDASLLGSLRAELLKNSFTDMADWKPDDAALVRYGLDQPITVTVDYTDSEGNAASRTLLIGSLTGEGSNYYCSPDGGQSVYLVGAASLTDAVAVAASGFDPTAEADQA